MAKYRPESRRKIEREVKDIKHRAKDRTKHMNNVKKDAKAITDVSKKIRSSGTIEAGKDIKRSLHEAGELIRLEFGCWRKKLENVARESYRKENELKERLEGSKSDYKELTKASSNIKETSAAKIEIDKGKQFSQKDGYIMKAVLAYLRGVRQSIQDLSYEIEATKTMEIVLNDGDREGDWAEFSLSPQEVKDVLEEHQMDIELRGPVLAKNRMKKEKLDNEE